MVSAESVVSTNARVIAQHIDIREDQLRQVVVPAMTLDALFAKHGIEELDLLQIGAEGDDWQVLQTLNLATTAPTLIQLETGHMARPDLSAMAGRLQDCGYLFFMGECKGMPWRYARIFSGIEQPFAAAGRQEVARKTNRRDC